MNSDRITGWMTLAETSGDYLIHLPFSGQGHLQQVAQGHVLLTFVYLQVYRLQVFLRNIFHCLATSLKKFSLMIKCNFLYFNFCLLPLVLSPGTTENSLSPSSLVSHIRYLCPWIIYPWALFSPDWRVLALSASPWMSNPQISLAILSVPKTLCYINFLTN